MTESERQEAIKILSEKLAKLEALPDLSAEAWPTFTGLPSSSLSTIFQWAADTGTPATQVLMVVAAIAFQHGRDQATLTGSAASDSI